MTFAVTARWKGSEADTVRIDAYCDRARVGETYLVFTLPTAGGGEVGQARHLDSAAWDLSRLPEPGWVDPLRSPWPITLESILADAASSDPVRSVRAARMLQQWGERESEVCQALGNLLVSATEDSLAEAAATALRWHREQGVSYLGAAVNHENVMARRASLQALMELPPERSLGAINVARPRLLDPDPAVRKNAARLFSKWGTEVEIAYPELIAGCADSVESVRA